MSYITFFKSTEIYWKKVNIRKFVRLALKNVGRPHPQPDFLGWGWSSLIEYLPNQYMLAK